MGRDGGAASGATGVTRCPHFKRFLSWHPWDLQAAQTASSILIQNLLYKKV